MARFLAGRPQAAVTAITLLLLPPAARAQAPVPAPHPTPRATPAPNLLFENHTLPELGPSLDFLDSLAGVRNRALSATGQILGGFAAVHDGRRQSAEAARLEANALADRDLRAAGTTGFRLESCAASPASCAEVHRRFSPETNAAIQRYFSATDRYQGWSDFGGATRHGWTPAERRVFLEEVGAGALSLLGERFVEKLQDKAQAPSWEPSETAGQLVQDTSARLAASRLDGFVAEMRAQPGPPAPIAVDPELHPAAGPAADRAGQALSDQGRAIDALNAASVRLRQDPAYADAFGARVALEASRLDASARRSDAQARKLSQSLDREPQRTRALLDRPRPAGLPSSAPAPAPPAVGSPAPAPPSPAAKAETDHCAKGAFKCPNGLPWPKCTHAEKYRCPPPEHAAEAARHKP